jgi:hypothetical protein
MIRAAVGTLVKTVTLDLTLSRNNREHQSTQLTATDVAAPLTVRCLGWGRAEAHKAAGELATRDTYLSSEEASFMIRVSLPIEGRILL